MFSIVIIIINIVIIIESISDHYFMLITIMYYLYLKDSIERDSVCGGPSTFFSCTPITYLSIVLFFSRYLLLLLLLWTLLINWWWWWISHWNNIHQDSFIHSCWTHAWRKRRKINYHYCLFFPFWWWWWSDLLVVSIPYRLAK